MEDLTGKDPNFVGLRHRIGVIFADYWADHTVFGMMFDTGFYSQKLGSVGDYQKAPREGCVIFVDAIRCARKPGEVDNQILWTTIHEIGHVFNLWHIDSPVRFLTQSSTDGAYDPANPFPDQNGIPLDIQFAFDARHKQYVKDCLADGQSGPNASYAWPGGEPFGTRGDGWPENRNFRDGLVLPSSRAAIELKIGMKQLEFYPFEPVELEIGLFSPAGIKKRYRVPSHVDPGYETFCIWIEESDGSRFRYRSPRIYCENPGTIEVEAGKPFQRDLSIFGQSGGYTFRKPGPHAVFATWVLPGGRVLESNRVEVYVKGRLDGQQEYVHRQQFLTRPPVAKLLYHRSGVADRHATEPLEELVGKTKDLELEVNLRYALGRFYNQAGIGRARSTRKRYERQARRHLDSALQNQPALSSRRCHHCKRVLDEISQR